MNVPIIMFDMNQDFIVMTLEQVCVPPSPSLERDSR